MIMIKKRNLLVILFSLIAVSFCRQKSCICETGKFRSGSGISWAHASNNLQDMINNASASDTICVAAGTYYGGFYSERRRLYRGGLMERKDPL